MKVNYGLFLVENRTKQGLSQQQLADILGYTAQAISNFERGRAYPDLSIWGKYAGALDLDLTSFLFAKNEKNNDFCATLKFDHIKFANNLKYLRKKNNLIQRDLAKMVEVNNKTIASWEKSKSFPSLDAFIRLCRLYQLQPDELYFVIKFINSKENNKPIKKKRVFIPIVLPIIIATTVGGGAAATSIGMMRNIRKAKNNSDSINYSNSDIVSSSDLSSFNDFSSEGTNSSSSLDDRSSEPPSSSSLNPSSNLPSSNLESDDFTYTQNSDNSLSISNINTDEIEIIIPETINGYPISSIDKNAITSLSAYQNKSLKKLIFPENTKIERFEEIAFEKYGSLENITLPINIKEITQNQFKDCNLLKEISIPSNVVTIDDYAFDGCTNIKTINIDSNILNKIDYCSFRYCYKLENINIPSSVTLIDEWAFQECNNLKTIELPNELLRINNNAFFYCVNLTEVIIPDKVNTLGIECFKLCSALEKIYIPNSVTYINHDAFADCPNLTIYCEASGEPDTWNSDWNSGNCPVVWGAVN